MVNTVPEVPPHFTKQSFLNSRMIKRSLRLITGYSFIVPVLVLYIAFVIIPSIEMFIMPFNISGTGFIPKWTWVGLENFQKAVSDDRFFISLKNNSIWALSTLLMPLVLGFLIAEVLTRAKIWGKQAIRSLLFIPQTLASVVVGISFMWIYNPNWGVLNTLLSSLGLDSLRHPWLGDPNTALLSLILAGVWRETPFFMVVFLSGMLKIPTELYDAAKVDGANALQEMIHITIPGIRPEITFMVLISIINGFKVFDLVQVMTRGGPFYQTEVLGHLVYKLGFTEFNFGVATALGVILTAIIFSINSLVLVYREKNA
jgi:raffinose/stachyose/melibiose transport system permease protein